MRTTLLLAAFMLFTTKAVAVPILEAGSIDTLLAQTTLSDSGESTEAAWVQSELGSYSLTYTQLSDTSSEGANWEAVDGGAEGDYAFYFGAGYTPAYFLIKTGGGSGAGADDTHFLYENNSSLGWAYVNLSDFGVDVSLDNIGIISHVGRSGERDVMVSEPASLFLMAMGLVAIAVQRRKL